MSTLDHRPAGTGRLTSFGRGLLRFARTQPFGSIALGVIIIFVLAALFAPLIAPYDPVAQHRDAIQLPPSGEFWLGTDDLGRDVFSRVLYGARTSLLVALATLATGGVLGSVIGIFSGYFGGRWIDSVLQRVMDTLMAIPGIVLLLFVAALLGPSVRNTIIALSLLVIPSFNRVARGQMLQIREELYVTAARANGCGVLRILRTHGLPNLLAPMLVVMSLMLAIVMIAESALSFLGVGTPPPTPSWGLMLSDGSRYMEIAPWMVVFPGGMLAVAVLAFNLLGDALRDFFDPKQIR
ncbi:peptide/nickel transport system permease protein/oligopeptide transport system permease protein [Tamaricihabitans halophyticus]|uniref:Peptide/nickel transport system permease protein/oligopeptide transport system permease protein n=1 Tax=Tamaricihabitans halophyticus TaxID=1262583 RepID=A0A4R2QEU3_9PSEU|nr:ABC transporter permease [Tamaricihabitans halophyticus]TCP46808.1 peptide/nickel transport system permease protein/oligopeptide transport system permease protein [Tamaricihabitans halophyticus]